MMKMVRYMYKRNSILLPWAAVLTAGSILATALIGPAEEARVAAALTISCVTFAITLIAIHCSESLVQKLLVSFIGSCAVIGIHLWIADEVGMAPLSRDLILQVSFFRFWAVMVFLGLLWVVTAPSTCSQTTKITAMAVVDD